MQTITVITYLLCFTQLNLADKEEVSGHNNLDLYLIFTI